MTTAKIQIISGPDQGVEAEIASAVYSIGTGEGNDLKLSDPNVQEEHASIALKDGRFAIRSQKANSTEINGTNLPALEWVWIPDSVTVQLSAETSFHFSVSSQNQIKANTNSDQTESSASSSKKPTSKKAGTTSKKRKRKVPRFRKEQSGEPLLKFGDDGQLPSLNLVRDREKEKEKGTTKNTEETSPLLYGALIVSLLFSVALLFLETDGLKSSKSHLSEARQEITKFYGHEETNLLPYQKDLRQAQLAHSRHDTKTERHYYRQVFSLLNSEGKNQLTGVTGSKAKDEELQRLLAILLR